MGNTICSQLFGTLTKPLKLASPFEICSLFSGFKQQQKNAKKTNDCGCYKSYHFGSIKTVIFLNLTTLIRMTGKVLACPWSSCSKFSRLVVISPCTAVRTQLYTEDNILRRWLTIFLYSVTYNPTKQIIIILFWSFFKKNTNINLCHNFQTRCVQGWSTITVVTSSLIH